MAWPGVAWRGVVRRGLVVGSQVPRGRLLDGVGWVREPLWQRTFRDMSFFLFRNIKSRARQLFSLACLVIFRRNERGQTDLVGCRPAGDKNASWRHVASIIYLIFLKIKKVSKFVINTYVFKLYLYRYIRRAFLKHGAYRDWGSYLGRKIVGKCHAQFGSWEVPVVFVVAFFPLLASVFLLGWDWERIIGEHNWASMCCMRGMFCVLCALHTSNALRALCVLHASCASLGWLAFIGLHA